MMALNESAIAKPALAFTGKTHVDNSFQATFQKFQDRGYRIALHIVGDPEEAKDIIQETYLKASSNLHQLHQIESMEGWLSKIVVNLSLKFLRRQKIRRYLLPLLPLPTPAPSLAAQAELKEAVRSLTSALERLPAKQRAAFVLKYIQEMSLEEISQCLGIRVSSVKTHLLRATKQL